MKMRYYVGHGDGKRVLFKHDAIPSPESHPEFMAVVGPFRTKRAAMLVARGAGPQIQSVYDAERYTRIRKNPRDTSHLTINRVGSPTDRVYATISRKNQYGEYVVRLYVDAKHHKDADYFTDDKSDAAATAHDMVKRASGFATNPRKRLSQAEMLKNPSDVLSGKSIETEYFGPGNVRGARIKASVIDGNKIQKSISISYPHELDMYAAHIKAAETMRDKMGWSGDLIGVQSRKGYVFGFEKFKTSRFGFERNPTLRASKQYKRKPHSRTHYDAKPSGSKMVYVQKKEGQMWVSVAVVKDSAQGRALAQKWAQRFHRKHPGSTLRLFV